MITLGPVSGAVKVKTFFLGGRALQKNFEACENILT